VIGRRCTALAALLFICTRPATADTLVDNVDGVTLDERGEVRTFAALQFGEDGRVKALYQRTDQRPKTRYRVFGRWSVRW
jgi:hypothetical protein